MGCEDVLMGQLHWYNAYLREHMLTTSDPAWQNLMEVATTGQR